MRAKKWWLKHNDQKYYLKFDRLVNERTARKRARELLGLKRFPPGTLFWIGNKNRPEMGQEISK